MPRTKGSKNKKTVASKKETTASNKAPVWDAHITTLKSITGYMRAVSDQLDLINTKLNRIQNKKRFWFW